MTSGPRPPAEPRFGPPDAGAPDDVDRVFARLTQLPPPRDFTTSVMLAVRGLQPYRLGRRQIAWAVAELCSVVVLALLAYVAGQAFVGGGALALIRAVAADGEVLSALPGDTLITLLEAVPWIELLGVVAMSLAVVTCTRHLTRALSEPPASAAPVTAGGAPAGVA